MKHYADDNKKAFTAKGEPKHGGRRFAKEGNTPAPKYGRHAAEEPASEQKKRGRHAKPEAEEPVRAAEAAAAAAPAAPEPEEAPAPKPKKRGLFSKNKKGAAPVEAEPAAETAPDQEPAAAEPEPEAPAEPKKHVLPKLRLNRKEIVRKTSFEEQPEQKPEPAAVPDVVEEAFPDTEIAIEPAPIEEDPGSQPAEAPEGEEMVDIVSSSSMLNADGTPDTDKVKKNTVIHVERPKRARTNCPATPTAPEPAMKAGYAPAFIFGGFLAVMAVLFIAMPKLGYSASEKRVLATFPKTDVDTVFSGQFGKDFETYFADHFPFRNMWVGVNSYTTLAEGNNGASGVYNGSDGYLINKPIKDYGRIPDNMGLLTEFKQSIDVPMTLVMVPSTGYICNDKLPLVHDMYRDDEYLDYIGEYANAVGIRYLDMRDTFKRAYRSGSQLYYRTDHHWTTEAAYLTYREYCKIFGLVTKPQEGFEVEEIGNFYGTTYSKSGFWLTPPDTLEIWKNPNNKEGDIHIQISDGDRVVKEQDSLFFYEHATEDDKYPVFIDGNHGKTIIHNQNANKSTLVVIKDSFTHCMATFLADSYIKVIMLDMRYSAEDITQLVKNEKPDQVLVLYGIDNFAEDTDLGHLWG